MVRCPRSRSDVCLRPGKCEKFVKVSRNLRSVLSKFRNEICGQAQRKSGLRQRPPRVGRLETQASLHQADCVGHTGSFQMLYGGCSAKRESILMPFPFMLQCYSRGMSARSTDLHTSPRQACMLTCALRRACMLQPGVRLQRSRVAAAHGARDSVTSHGVTAVARAEARAAASARAAARAAAGVRGRRR